LLLHFHHWFFFYKFFGLSHKTIGQILNFYVLVTVKLA
jgi:hypothetical protein